MRIERVIQMVGGLVLSVSAPLAFGHTIGAQGAGFAAGLSHPFVGLDHMLAMLAVGLWAAQLGGRALWRVPLAFMTMMVLGSLLALGGLAMPAVETGIAVSVLVLGLLIALAARFPLAAGMLLVGAFALFHGHAHGQELPQAASAFLYSAGFLLATGVLHAAGAGLGILPGRGLPMIWRRALGGGIAAVGLVLWVGV